MKNLSAISLLGLVSFLGLALFWAAGGVSFKQIMGWGYSVVYTPQPQGKVEESMNRVAAVHYDLVCATCHGSPADPQRGKQLRLSPPAPSLHLRAEEMPPEMMFQVVKDGIKNTAMPGWPALGRDDEVWLMVAFLEKLPNLSAEQYQSLTVPAGSAKFTLPLSTCMRCHGPNPAFPVTPGLPRIDFQSPTYISDSLRAYRHRARASGFMQSAASGLSDVDIENLAKHLGHEQSESFAQSTNSSVALDLALRGSDLRQIPACTGCHGRTNPARSNFPRLKGQNQKFLETQLRLFASEPQLRGGGMFADLMREAARNLQEHDIKSLSEWYSAPESSKDQP